MESEEECGIVVGLVYILHGVCANEGLPPV